MKVRYYGAFGYRSGYGIAAEGNVRALIAVGADVVCSPIADAKGLPGVPFLEPGETAKDVDVAILHGPPLSCIEAGDAVREVNPNATCVAFTTWEALDAPMPIVEGLRKDYTKILVPDEGSQRALRADAVIPHVLDAKFQAVPAPPAAPPYRFAWIGTWHPHKNPWGAITAYCHAFSPADAVELIVCSAVTLEQKALILTAMGISNDQLPHITWISNVEDIRSVYAQSHCLVSASHGEAWNLPLFEGLQAGRHIIAPKGLGSDTYLVGTSAALYASHETFAILGVRAELRDNGVEIQRTGFQGQSVKLTWGEPDLVALAWTMRTAYEGQVNGIRIEYDMETRFGMRTVGELLLRNLT